MLKPIYLFAISTIILLLCNSCKKNTTFSNESINLKPAGIKHLSEYKSSVASVVVRDTIYIFGGNLGEARASSKVEMFDIKTQQTFVLPITLNDYIISGGCAVVGENIYLFGGKDINIFNITTKKIIKTFSNVLTDFKHPQAVALVDKIYLFEGDNGVGGHLPKVFIFNTQNSSLEEFPDVMIDVGNNITFGHKTVLLNSKIYIIPAYNDYTNKWQVLDPVTKIISLLPFNSKITNGPAMVSLNNKIIVLGGYGSNGNTGEIRIFDPASIKENVLSIKLNQKKLFLSGVVANNGHKIIVLGGSYFSDTNTYYSDDIEIFDVVYE